MSDVIVVQKDMRALRYCSRGVRDFFRRHELDYSNFLKNGIPASQLEETGDAMALAVVEVARGRNQ